MISGSAQLHVVEHIAVKVVGIGRDETPIGFDEVSVNEERNLQEVNLRFSGSGESLARLSVALRAGTHLT
jgi:hypothetical protein